MMKFLKNLDQFGVSFQPSIQYSTSEYKTCQGGAVSILLYGLSFSYLIYMIVQWQTGQILPKITTLASYESNYEFTINDTYIEIEARKYRYTTIDPFNASALILQPVIYYFVNGDAPQKGIPQEYDVETNTSNFQKIILKNQKLQVSQDENQVNPQIEMMLVFGSCIDDYLLPGQKCADDDAINNFFDQYTNTLIAKLYVKQFNTGTGRLDSIGKEFIIPLEKDSTYYAQVSVQISKTSVDTGFLLESMDEYIYITDNKVTGNAMGANYFKKVFGIQIYSVFYYSIDSIQQVQQVAYPKISEILADAGSIASTLLLLSYLVIMMNQKYLEYEAINHIIGMYYPEFRNVKILKNIFGKIIKVEKSGRNLDLNYFLPYYERLKRIGSMKLTISNQIYEISRLQFLMQSQFSVKFIQQFHKAGIPLLLPQQEQIGSKEDGNSKLDQSLNQEYQYKTNQIVTKYLNNQLPNCKSNDDLREHPLKETDFTKPETSMPQQLVLNQTQDKLIKNPTRNNSEQLFHIDHHFNDFCLKDRDFELLVFQEEDFQLELNSQSREQLKKNVSNEELLQEVQAN